MNKQDWTHDALNKVFDSDTHERRVARLRSLGVIDDKNQLTEKARSWGDKVSQTETAKPTKRAGN